jgi:hypothetical protein
MIIKIINSPGILHCKNKGKNICNYSFKQHNFTVQICNKKMNELLLTVNYSKLSLLVSNVLAIRFYGEQDGEQL